MKEETGVTLLEVMVVVVIVGLLAAIAVPAYDNYVTRSRRSDAFTALETVRAAQEMYRAERGFYAPLITDLAGCNAGMAGANYNLVLTGRDTTGDAFWEEYEITADAQARQTGDFDFRIDQNGVHWYDDGSGWDNDKEWEELRKL
jgi:type IV pilus assembly protein PilE